jgi:hypothetical protein
MNELSLARLPRVILAAIFLAGMWLPASVFAQGNKMPLGEEFFIIASVDQPKSELLLKRPNEVTLLMKVDQKTQYADETGKAIRLSDFRAGDTVWVVSTRGSKPTAIRIRKGRMTVADLHRYYLDYPEIK